MITFYTLVWVGCMLTYFRWLYVQVGKNLNTASKGDDDQGSTISTSLHGEINPKDWQVLSLGDAVFLCFSNCLGLFQVIMANPDDDGQ